MLSDISDNDFGYLSEDSIYLDSACQTLRPQPVIEAIDDYYREYNACGGRVKYAWGNKVDEAVQKTRDQLLKLAGKSDRDYICAFTLNTTYGINLILSQLSAGTFQHIITSQAEHNSVFLPSITYARKLDIDRLVLARKPDGGLDYQPDQLKDSIVLVNTTSNFDGLNLANAAELTDDVHQQGGIVIFDAAQTMAHNPGLIQKVDFDAICFSGHKMYGPSLGVIIIKKSLLERLEFSFIGGGTVETVSQDYYKLLRDEPASWLEAGLQNYSGIIGLGAAVGWLEHYRPDGQQPLEYEAALSKQLYEALKAIPGLTVINKAPSSIISFYSDKIDAHRLAVYLSAQNIMARSGYFCCHYYLDEIMGYPPLLRLSLGLNNTKDQVAKVADALGQQIGAR